MPGFTAHSMFPRMWAAGGMDYPELVDRLLQLALRASRRPALSGRPGQATRCRLIPVSGDQPALERRVGALASS